MTDYSLTAGPGSLTLTGQPADLRFVLPDFTLDPQGPFFRYVLTYLAASAGLTPVYDAEHYPDFMQNTAARFPGAAAGDARINLAECVRLVRAGALPQQDAEILLCCMLANSAFESLTDGDHKRLEPEPVYQFFKHVRNAASHGNLWYFKAGQPSSRAAHGALVIDAAKGDANPQQGKACFYNTLKPADLLYLLRDVEQLLAQAI